MMKHLTRTAVAALVVVALAACGGDDITDPTNVELGETTFVFVVNPTVNDANSDTAPPPGANQGGVDITLQDGPSGTTGSDGVSVFAAVDSGTHSVSFSDGEGSTGQLSLTLNARDLMEVAVALTDSGAAEMASVPYEFGGEVVEITSDMPVSDVNEALANSNRIVFVRGGTYTGDINFSGSSVTLFGEGPEGGNVTLDGDVTVDGSGNRLRGVRITGTLSVPGSDAGISFSSVQDSLVIDGSDAVLLNNAICGPVTIEASGTVALGNAGMAPVPEPGDGC